jgi:hypothetical protein
MKAPITNRKGKRDLPLMHFIAMFGAASAFKSVSLINGQYTDSK